MEGVTAAIALAALMNRFSEGSSGRKSLRIGISRGLGLMHSWCLKVRPLAEFRKPGTGRLCGTIVGRQAEMQSKMPRSAFGSKVGKFECVQVSEQLVGCGTRISQSGRHLGQTGDGHL